jgi:hypothetical protein
LKISHYFFVNPILEKREAFLYEKAIKTDIYAVRFELITVFSFKKRNFLQDASRFLQKRPIFHYGTVRANAFFFELICFNIIAERWCF